MRTLIDGWHGICADAIRHLQKPHIREALGKSSFALQKMAEKLVTPTRIELVFQP